MADRNTEVDDPKLLEVDIRLAMWRHHMIEPRGFDTIQARAKIHADIDALFDRRAESLMLLALEQAG